VTRDSFFFSYGAYSTPAASFQMGALPSTVPGGPFLPFRAPRWFRRPLLTLNATATSTVYGCGSNPSRPWNLLWTPAGLVIKPLDSSRRLRFYPPRSFFNQALRLESSSHSSRGAFGALSSLPFSPLPLVLFVSSFRGDHRPSLILFCRSLPPPFRF